MDNRPENPLLPIRQYHDLERRSYLTEHTLTTRGSTKQVITKELTSNTTLNNTHELVLVDCSGGSITIRLPSVQTYPYKQYRIKKIDSTLNQVIVKTATGELLDGDDEWYITFQYDCMDIISDNDVEWRHN